MKKINMFVGRLQPITKGHVNCINEGDGPCIVYRINSSDKKIERKKKGIKIASKSWSDESVNKVIEYIDNPTGDLTDQEKELLKRPFTNELIDKELEIVKKSNKNIIDVIPVVNMFEALARFNKFILDHQDEYEPQYWMCGDDRVDNYSELIDKYDKLAIERGGEEYDNVVKGKLKTSTGKGRTEGVSGTAVRKAILTKDKSAFEKIMPKGTGSMFNDFIKAFDDFKIQLQNIIKEHKMMTLKEYIYESEVISINEKLSFGDAFYKFCCKIYGLECVTQDKYIKKIKAFVQEHSNNKCSIIIKTYKQIKSDLDNCLNQNENVPMVGGGHMTIKEAIDKGKWFNDITLNDNTPFVCYYSKDNKNKYVLEQDSLFFIAAKTKKGYRDIISGLSLNTDDPIEFGWRIKNVKIPQTLDYEQWEANEKKEAEEKKKQEQESIKASIKRMEDELAQLKELVKNKE